mgnify:CR=1 FL=1
MKELKNELEFINNCIEDLKKIQKWTEEEKEMFYELIKRKRKLEAKLNGLIKRITAET